MSFIHSEHIGYFNQLIGSDYVLTDAENLEKYSFDATERLRFPPNIILKPRTAYEVSEIMKFCYQHQIPVTPRGGGTGLSGGALAYNGGVLLSLERMNNIVSIDEQNLQVVTDSGVITETLQNAVMKKGLFFPPDPASRGTCMIGGNIAENSGGPKSVKYGVVKDYVLNLEVVLPTGEIIWTGANVLKNVTGYNLTQLFIGSEGTLGIITKAVLKLIPLPAYDMAMLSTFTSMDDACRFVTAIFKAGFTPSGLELMDIDSVKLAAAKTKTVLPVNDELAAHLVIELDGNDQEQLMREAEKIALLLEEHQVKDILLANDALQKDEIWKLRRRVAEIVKAEGFTIEEGTVVPRAMLSQLVSGVKQLGQKHNFSAVCYGHAGDDNLHVRIKKDGIPNSWQNEEMKNILTELFTLVKTLGGTITAEHGVGLVQKDYLHLVYPQKQIEIMRFVKRVFDPGNILNAGKIFD